MMVITFLNHCKTIYKLYPFIEIFWTATSRKLRNKSRERSYIYSRACVVTSFSAPLWSRTLQLTLNMSNIGKLFKIGGSKAPRPPRRDYDENRSSSECSEDDESYLDPATVHPTSSPTTPPVVMPSYPPPRPNHSPANRRVHDAGKRASVPVTFGQMNKPPVPKARAPRPQSAEHLQAGKGHFPSQRFKVWLTHICKCMLSISARAFCSKLVRTRIILSVGHLLFFVHFLYPHYGI